jgi:hypothetical protein
MRQASSISPATGMGVPNRSSHIAAMDSKSELSVTSMLPRSP